MSTRSRKRRRKEFWFRRRTPPGTEPGTVTVDPSAPQSIVTVIAYGPDKLVEQQITDLSALKQFVDRWPVVWVNVDGLGDAKAIRSVSSLFGLHELAVEDVVNVHQRAKVEEYPEHTFIVCRMVELNDRLETEQVSIFLGRSFVLTFQERPGQDSLEPVRERLRRSRGKIRSAGADYLAYSLIDGIIDGYFPVLEQYGERLERLEEEVIWSADRATIAQIHEVKADLLVIRRALWPHREAISSLIRDRIAVIQDDTRIYLRDCYDHSVQLIDLLETYSELGADLRDLYLSSLSNRMNEIIKVLTVISTIFIPLTFIAGVYGMNFNTEASPWNMPELNWYYGYPLSLALMAMVTAGLLVFFWRKGWLSFQSVDEVPKSRPPDEKSTRQ